MRSIIMALFQTNFLLVTPLLSLSLFLSLSLPNYLFTNLPTYIYIYIYIYDCYANNSVAFIKALIK